MIQLFKYFHFCQYQDGLSPVYEMIYIEIEICFYDLKRNQISFRKKFKRLEVGMQSEVEQGPGENQSIATLIQKGNTVCL